jgi:hypothetical protein
MKTMRRRPKPIESALVASAVAETAASAVAETAASAVADVVAS